MRAALLGPGTTLQVRPPLVKQIIRLVSSFHPSFPISFPILMDKDKIDFVKNEDRFFSKESLVA